MLLAIGTFEECYIKEKVLYVTKPDKYLMERQYGLHYYLFL